MKEQVCKAHASGLLLGISGGLDSALATFLVKKAFPKDSLGVILPCDSNPEDINDAMKVVELSNIEFIKIDLTDNYNRLMENIFNKIPNNIKGNSKIARANTKARLRMCTLYAISNYLNYLVVGTDNAAEIYTGYFTKYGDGGADIMPLANLTKREVRIWAEKVGVPKDIIIKPPSAGLWADQTDEEEMGITYDVIDDFLEGKEIPKKELMIINDLHRKSEHKRKIPSYPPKY
ncbi:MAG TPA: NAD(+) synthase [Thermoanaerobacterales bacterium]|nr:NAD(+) synthase [Thermoanaerobacterales bacterium]